MLQQLILQAALDLCLSLHNLKASSAIWSTLALVLIPDRLESCNVACMVLLNQLQPLL